MKYDVVLFMLLPLVGGYISGLSMLISPWKEWYSELKKPFWNPPSWLFGPVWTTLYIMMGYASNMIWTSKSPLKTIALAAYFTQLIVNLSWSPIFFGLKRPDIALIVIGALWFLVIATMILFYKINQVAGLLLAPYLLWVTYASTLNAYIATHNETPKYNPKQEKPTQNNPHNRLSIPVIVQSQIIRAITGYKPRP
jgi:tryptophan-rich sensory protein